MGTDIHGVVEEHGPQGWNLVYVLHSEHPAGHRNYKQFAALAGVRGEGPEPRGMPADICAATRYLWETGGDHTPSWLTVKEAIKVFNERPRYAAEPPHVPSDDFSEEVEYWFGDSCLSRDDRFVFWFDS